jgi:hypothetical protein
VCRWCATREQTMDATIVSEGYSSVMDLGEKYYVVAEEV